MKKIGLLLAAILLSPLAMAQTAPRSPQGTGGPDLVRGPHRHR